MIKNFLNYLQYEKRSSEHTISAYENDLRQFTEFCTEHLAINEADFDSTQVKFPIVRAWVVQLIDNQINPRSVNRKIASLNAYYKYLLQRGLIIELPTKKLKSLKVSKKLPSFVKQQEIGTMALRSFT
ncbi:MAG: site-specific integrase, partial [Bacteroidota bacterium]